MYADRIKNWASEDSLCNSNDTLWLEEFYQRILEQTDSLSQYQKLINKPVQQSRKWTTQRQTTYYVPKEKQTVYHMPKERRAVSPVPKKEQKCYYTAVMVIIIITIVLAVATIVLSQ